METPKDGTIIEFTPDPDRIKTVGIGTAVSNGIRNHSGQLHVKLGSGNGHLINFWRYHGETEWRR